jgi:hypothetical protein
VITGEQAEDLTCRMVRPDPDHPGAKSSNLLEFDAGWLIQEHAALQPGFRGAVMRVVERATGRVAGFLPPSRRPGFSRNTKMSSQMGLSRTLASKVISSAGACRYRYVQRYSHVFRYPHPSAK